MLAALEQTHDAGDLERLAEALPAWLETVPLYQGRCGSETSPLDCFRRLPLITKADIRRDFPKNFLGDRADLDSLLEQEVIELEHTSGTSEPRIPLLLPRGWWAEQERTALALNPRVKRLLDSAPGARRVTLSSPVCSGEVCYTGVPSREERTIGNTLFASLSKQPFLWSEADLERIAQETLDWQPLFLDVDPVYGVVFARYCEQQGIRLPSLKFVICTYEFVSAVHRRILQRVFGVPVLDLYGSTETGHLLMEDKTGNMSPSRETAVLEVIEADANGVGELIVSTLTNDFMPLLRYRIGDLVEPRPHADGTSYIVHGRAADAFARTNLPRVTVWQVDRCVADVPGVAHYQFVQRGPGEWLFRFVPDLDGLEGAAQEEILARLSDAVVGRGALRIESKAILMPESSGKFRLCYPPQDGR